MKRLLIILAAVVLVVVMAVPAMAATSAPISVTATVGTSGAPPVVCAKFETPDNSSATGTQVLPTPGADRPVKFYVILDDPNGKTDVTGVDIQVMYPTFGGALSGKQKMDIQAGFIGGVWIPLDNATAVRPIVSGDATSDWVDLLADGKTADDPTMAAALPMMQSQGRLALGWEANQTAEQLGDPNTYLLHNVLQNKVLMLEITAMMDPCEPALNYTVNVVGTDAEGNTTPMTGTGTPHMLTNTFQYLGIQALVLDFGTLNWGTLNINAENKITGDNSMSTPNSPTIENLGNAEAMVQINSTPLTGATYGKKIVNFDAAMNQLATSDSYGPLTVQRGYIQYNANNNVTINVGTDPSPSIAPITSPSNVPVMLPPCSTAQIDFSVVPYGYSPADSYTGSMIISLLPYAATNANPTYNLIPNQSNATVQQTPETPG
jgi:hypothetical protein